MESWEEDKVHKFDKEIVLFWFKRELRAESIGPICNTMLW